MVIRWSLRNVVVVTACLLSVGACSSPSNPADAGHHSDGGLADPAHDECTQPGDLGNSIHVGQYCTIGGNECDPNTEHIGWAFLCTLDTDPTAPLAMCTRNCFLNSECGENAVCVGDSPAQKCNHRKGCVPKKCTDDPGLDDASVCDVDAGSTDAGN